TVSGLGSLGVTGFDIARTLGLDSHTAAGSGDLVTLALGGLDAQLGGGVASLHLTGASLNVDSFVTATQSYLYAAGTGFPLAATLGRVSAAATGVAFTYNPSSLTDWSFAGGPAAVSAQYFNVHGGATSFTVSGLGSLGVSSFDIARTLGLASGTSAGSGDLFTLALAGLDAQLGGSAASLHLSGASLNVDSFVTASASYLYAAGPGFSCGATLGPVAATTTGVLFTYNPSSLTDWSFAGGPAAVTAQYFNVHGGATSFTVSGLGSLGVSSFDIARTLGLASGTSAGSGDLFTLALAGLDAQLG